MKREQGKHVASGPHAGTAILEDSGPPSGFPDIWRAPSLDSGGREPRGTQEEEHLHASKAESWFTREGREPGSNSVAKRRTVHMVLSAATSSGHCWNNFPLRNGGD